MLLLSQNSRSVLVLILTLFTLIGTACSLKCLQCFGCSGRKPAEVDCDISNNACWSVSPEDKSRTQVRLCGSPDLMKGSEAKVGACTEISGEKLVPIMDLVIASTRNNNLTITADIGANATDTYLQCACDTDLCNNAKEKESATAKGEAKKVIMSVSTLVFVSSLGVFLMQWIE